MRITGRIPPKRVALAAFLVLGLSTQASAQTQCDLDPQRVLFQATVDPTQINKLLQRLGDRNVNIGVVPVTLGGLCTDHQMSLRTGAVTLPFGNAPFVVTPSQGSIRVDLTLSGPFVFGLDGSTYRGVNCDSFCVIEVPYLGEFFNGCDIEEFIVGPLLRTIDAGASFDDLNITQRADTCVLGDCTAVHPLESTNVDAVNFDVDLTGFGSCKVELDFPDPLPDLEFDPCQGLDPLIESLLEPELESAIERVFVTRDGKGTLIQVFSFQITKDGCADIPEVKNCKAGQTAPIAGLTRAPRNPALSAALYLLPLGLVGGLVFRVRRRRS
jgi:hypothetical protein